VRASVKAAEEGSFQWGRLSKDVPNIHEHESLGEQARGREGGEPGGKSRQ
jgi:hypothetical protein